MGCGLFTLPLRHSQIRVVGQFERTFPLGLKSTFTFLDLCMG
jgi:hypothetical protein